MTCVSDLHGDYPRLDGGDLLIIAGDITSCGLMQEWAYFFAWVKEQSYRKIILVGGNHDAFLNFSCSSQEARDIGVYDNTEPCEYLVDSGCEFDGLKIWGSPWTSWFKDINPRCAYFTERTERALDRRWEMIPPNIDVLVTHSPPYGILDENRDSLHCGSKSLRERLDHIRPKLHVFGHIHEEGGKTMVLKRPGIHSENNTLCVNASIMDENYRPMHKPVDVEI